MTLPHYHTRPGDWLTVACAALEFGVPHELLEKAIQVGDVPVAVACGARVVQRSEVQAWALMLKIQMRECDKCGE